MLNSWDAFDTLITRFSLAPEDVFHRIDRDAQGLDFRKRRLAAQAALDRIGRPYVLHDIYHRMVADGLPPDQAAGLIAYELECERDVLFPIRAVVERVQPGDLVISDMYWPDDVLTNMLRDICGLHDLRPVLRSNWGKATGTIWPEIQRHMIIRRHHGDNLHSDVERPKALGIPVEHITLAGLTAWEEGLAKSGQGLLALVQREARLRAVPHQATPVHDHLAGAYLTLLYAAASWLMQGLPPGTPVAFLRRDTDDLARVFQTLFPFVPTQSLDLSRMFVVAAGFDSDLAGQLKPGSVLVDMLATGRSALAFASRNRQKVKGFATIIHLDGLLTQDEVPWMQQEVNAGRMMWAIKQSELRAHHYPLECLLQTPHPQAVSLGYEAQSGGVVRSYGAMDLTPPEAALIIDKQVLLSAFANAIRSRRLEGCDVATAERLMRMSLDRILAETRLNEWFPSFVERERTGAV